MGKVYITKIIQNTWIRMLGVKSTDFITVKDVSANEWIVEFAKHLKKGNKIAQPDWLYTRAAAVMRKLYLRPYRGVAFLANEFGGKRRNGVARKHHARGTRKCIRYVLSELERVNLVEMDSKDKDDIQRRRVTAKGQTDMNRIAQTLYNADR